MKLAVAVFVFVAFLGVSTPARPHQVLIHGEKWEFAFFHDGPPGLEGFADCHNKIMGVRKGLPPGQISEVVWHEILHALSAHDGKCNDRDWNNSDDENDEATEGHAGIYWGGAAIAGFMNENREFVRWVQDQR